MDGNERVRASEVAVGKEREEDGRKEGKKGKKEERMEEEEEWKYDVRKGDREEREGGMRERGGFTFLWYVAIQSVALNQGCCLISWTPFFKLP